MNNSLLLKDSKSTNSKLNDLINKYEEIIEINIEIKNEKEFEYLENLNKNIIQLKFYYDLLLDYFADNSFSLIKYKLNINKDYLKLLNEDNLVADYKNIEVINNNLNFYFIEKINKIYNYLNIKKHKFYILDLNIKIKIVLDSIWDGFFPLNVNNRFVKNDYYHLVKKIEILNEVELSKINDEIKERANILIILSHKYRNKIKLKKIFYELFFNKKNLLKRKVESYSQVDIKDVITLYDCVKNSKAMNSFNYFANDIKFELTLFFPINDNFYNLDDIDFNKFDYKFFDKGLDRLKNKLDETIKNNNENLKKIKLTKKPKRDNYFECKLITKMSTKDLRNEKLEKRIIIHLSGGGYIINGYDYNKYHLNKIINKKSDILYSVIYRLGPKYSYPDPLNDLINVYFYILEKFKNKNVKILMYGDSAGGHLILCLINFLILFKKKIPDKIILIYPALEFSNLYFKKGIFMSFDDPILNLNLIIQIRNLIFKRENLNCEKNILTNPSFFYDFIIEKYPSVTIIYSTKDPLHYSIINFFNILKEFKVNANAYELKNLYHSFLGQIKKFNFNFKEINIVVDILKKELEI